MKLVLSIQTKEFQLIADGETVATTANLISAVGLWIASFYVFNLAYPSSLNKTLLFCQNILLGIIEDVSSPRPVITHTNKLNVYNSKSK